jgi:hypothetical protein
MHVMPSVWPPMVSSRIISPVVESTNCREPSEKPRAITAASARAPTQRANHSTTTHGSNASVQEQPHGTIPAIQDATDGTGHVRTCGRCAS